MRRSDPVELAVELLRHGPICRKSRDQGQGRGAADGGLDEFGVAPAGGRSGPGKLVGLPQCDPF